MANTRNTLVKGAINKLFGRSGLSKANNKEIRNAADGNHTLKMVYTRKDGKTKTYYGIEPYEFKGKYFYGYHPAHGQIHSFIKDRIHSAEETNRSYKPKWDVKI